MVWVVTCAVPQTAKGHGRRLFNQLGKHVTCQAPGQGRNRKTNRVLAEQVEHIQS
jgi:hypothetical protein